MLNQHNNKTYWEKLIHTKLISQTGIDKKLLY